MRRGCKKGNHFDDEGNLRCTVCNIYKSQNEFYNNKKLTGRNGKSCQCKKCMDKRPRHKEIKYKEENLEKFLRNLYLGCKNRCLNRKKYKIFDDFNLTKEYLKELYNEQKGKCKLSGIVMTYILNDGKKYTNISIDRINPKKGYYIGNVRLVCTHINMMRSNLSDKELLYFCKEIINNYGK